MARLDFVGRNEVCAGRLMREIEDLELAIAAAPASDAGDIAIKARLLKEALAMETDNSFETILLSAVIRDCDRLAERVDG